MTSLPKKGLETMLLLILLVFISVISLKVLGDTSEHNVTFSNISNLNLTVNISSNATYIISVTNNNDSNRSYNLSVDYGLLNTSQINLTGYSSTNITLDVWNQTNMTVYSVIYATLADNASIILNSSEDFGSIKTIILDNVPPQLSNISNSSITNQSALISWSADEDVNGTVFYGTSSGNRSLNASNFSFSSYMQVWLTNLLSNTTYYYVVNASDSSGNQNRSDEYNFSTLPTYAAPAINSVEISDNITQNNTPVVVTVNVSRGTSDILYVNAEGYNLTNLTDPGANTSLWNGTVNLTSNASPIDVVVEDVSGQNATNSNLTFVIDDVPPQISILSPVNYQNISVINFSVNYSIIEDYLFQVTIFYNGTSNGTLNTTNGELNLNLSPGLNQNISILAVDQANNSNATYVNFSVDVQNPTVTCDYNITDWINYTATINFSGLDPGISTGIQGFFYCLSQDSFNCTNFTNGPQVNISLNGNNTLRYFSQDYAGNNATIQNISVLTDTIAPSFTLSPVNLYNASTYSTSQSWGYINFTWLITENHLDISNWSVNSIYMGNISINGSNQTNVSVGLNQNVSFHACDLAGNCNSTLRYFNVDRFPPNISIVWTLNTTWVNYTEVVVNASAYDDLNGVGVNRIQACGGAPSPPCALVNVEKYGNNTVNITLDSTPAYPDGTYLIRFRAFDYAGLMSNVSQAIVLLDRTPPVIDISEPLNNSNISAHNLTFTWQVEEENFWNLTYLVNGTVQSNLTQNSSFTFENISHGLNQTLRLISNDKAGNSNSTAIQFNVDWYAPVSSSDFTNLSSYVNYTALINFSANETNGVGVHNFYYCIGNISCEPNSTGTSANVTSDGINYIRFYGVDYAGNNESSMNLNGSYHSHVAYIDTSGPTITTPYLSVWRNYPVNVSLNISDQYSGPNRTVHLLEGYSIVETNFSSNQSSNATTVSVNQSGNYTLEFYGFDNLQNRAQNKTIFILFDNQSPNATINSLPQYSKAALNISYNATDFNLSGIDRVYLYYKRTNAGNQNYSLLTSTTTSPFSIIMDAEGNYSFAIIAKDKAGNNQTLDYRYNSSTLIDGSSPSLNITYPQNNGVIYESSLNTTWQVFDAHLSNVTISIDGGSYVSNTSPSYYTFTNLSAGTHRLRIKAMDLAGNSVEKSVNFSIRVALNVAEFLSQLNSYNSDASSFQLTDAVAGTNYSDDVSLNISSISADLTFYVNYSDTAISSNSKVVIKNFELQQATYSSVINITKQNPQLNQSITQGGYSPQILLSVTNMSEFIANQSAYFVNATFNISNLTYDYIQYCLDNTVTSCSILSNCSTSDFSISDQNSCYKIVDSDLISVYLSSFSSIAFVRDDILTEVSIKSPTNNSNLATGSLVYLNFSTGELVYGNYTFDNQNSIAISSTNQYFNLLNGTLNVTYKILNNGEHNITIYLSDNASNTGAVVLRFNVSDYYAPTINSITVAGNSTTSSTGTAIIRIVTDEFARCWYAQSDSTLVASVSDLSSYPQASNGRFATVHNITHTYRSSGTVNPYYVTCQDALGNNMSTNENSDYFYTYYNYVGTPTGGGGGGGSSPSRPLQEQFVPPDNWGLYNDLFWDYLEQDVEQMRSVRVNRIAIRNVTLKTILPQRSALVRVVELLRLPRNVPLASNTWDKKPVYQYLSLIKENITNDVLKEIILNFEVSKFWIRNNQANASLIKLYRFNDFEWQELPTRLTGENDEYMLYTSQTPGLSYFAVVSTQTLSQSDNATSDNTTLQEVAKNASQQVQVFNDSNADKNKSEHQPEVQEQQGNLLWLYILVSVVTFLVIMYAVLFKYYKWKKRYF